MRNPILCLLAMTAALGGCSSYWTSTYSPVKTVQNKQALLTTADLRGVYARNRNGTEVFCAEPSPDVAKIAAASFDASAAGSASSIGQVVSPELAVTLAMSRSEALAQLGQRLATIQLLRDGLYRACEAFANKAIDEMTYGLLISRYDEVMVTMLLGELAAGTTARHGPIILTSSGSATGTALVEPNADLVKSLSEQRDTEVQNNGKIKDLFEAANQAASSGTAPAPGAKSAAELKQELDASNQKISDLNRLIASARGLAAAASATTGTAAPAIVVVEPASDQAAVAAAITMMQSAYLNDSEADALLVACITTPRTSDLAQECKTIASDHKLVEKLFGTESLRTLLSATSNDSEELKRRLKALLDLKAQLNQAMAQP